MTEKKLNTNAAKTNQDETNNTTCFQFSLEFILKKIVRLAVSVLAILMTIMIFFSVIDVAKEIYKSFITSANHFPGINELLLSFGAFMAVLIAIEILINITIYLQDNSIHTKVVMATALIAVARKIIVMDIEKTAPQYIWAIAAVILATSIGYWLAMIAPEENQKKHRPYFNSFKKNNNNNEQK